MARGKERDENGASPMVSIIGAGTHIYGDCVTEGTLRIEGQVTGSVYAGKAVVVGQAGIVVGDVRTQDAVISGTVTGMVVATSRLEVHAASRIDGGVRTRRLHLEEGAVLNGEVRMGEVQLGPPPYANDIRARAEEASAAVLAQNYGANLA